MKKTLFITLLSITGLLCSCNFDVEENASYTGQYCGYLDSLVFDNPDDTIFAENIALALKADSIVYVIFSESVSIDIPSQATAMAYCNMYAANHYKNIVSKASLQAVKKKLFTQNNAYDQYGSYNDIPLQPFKAYVSLINPSSTICRDTLYIK